MILKALRFSSIIILCLLIFFPGLVSSSAFSILEISDRSVDIPVSGTDQEGAIGVNTESSVQTATGSQKLVEVTNNLKSDKQTEINLDNKYEWKIADASGSNRVIPPGQTESYNVDLSSVGTTDTEGQYIINAGSSTFRIILERTVNFQQPENILTVANPSVSDSTTHTWSLENYQTPLNSNGERKQIDSITVDYTNTGTDFDNVTQAEVTVTLTRQLSGGPDRDKISVNQEDYTGEKATIDLAGFSTTSVVDDPMDESNIVIEIDKVQNPSSTGIFSPDITFNLDDGSTSKFTSAEFQTQTLPFFDTTITNAPDSIPEAGTATVDYEIQNTGSASDTQDILFNIDGVTEDTNSSVSLGPSSSISDSFTYNDTGDDIQYKATVKSDNSSDSIIFNVSDRFLLNAESNTANQKTSHTWNASDIQFNGEVDTVTVDYPSSFSFDGLNQDDITVTMTRQLSSGRDTSEIDINQDSYSGSSATFDLSGSFNTDLVGSMKVEISGIENGNTGDYSPSITLNGPNDSFTYSSTSLNIK